MEHNHAHHSESRWINERWFQQQADDESQEAQQENYSHFEGQDVSEGYYEAGDMEQEQATTVGSICPLA
jgi:hypothetical protein